ncbi:hypothetical protein C4901_16700 [Acidiferrobacter sp. SPIII_3]|jgi:hypothetical protein|uniref:hypothetical protein n=1 Tax=Acidiferrobacter sp. SPIII_3 TaxID=1281578 RepID=UPI000D7266F0|nr:hypothetical protein [Acidiferrobacter sp. SPIII_3]AWP24754.1 hypothetical protein C4901_16700 [Acidiferrobacter sp. SPIII_3]
MRETWQAREMFLGPFVWVVETGGKDEVRDTRIGMTREGRLVFVARIEHSRDLSPDLGEIPYYGGAETLMGIVNDTPRA